MGNTQYILSLSYGKDSLACLEAIRLLGLPLDRIVHAEVWATDIIPADLPPMVEFKKKADCIIKERYGIEVEHVTAIDKLQGGGLSYEKQFYKRLSKGKYAGRIYGFPIIRGSWCVNRLKQSALRSVSENDLRKDVLSQAQIRQEGGRNSGFPHDQERLLHETENDKFLSSSLAQGADINIVQYLGIAADEPERIKRHTKPGVRLPLVEIGWDEAYCRKWCEENDLLSPIYTDTTRGGCWFCHKQSIDQLRKLRHNYPDLWSLLMKWDLDSPVTFKPDGHTVHDFDKRFALEDEGKVPTDRTFRWKMISDNNSDN